MASRPNSTRTTHRATTHTTIQTLAHQTGTTADEEQHHTPGRAETEDRETRKRWRTKLRSAYLHAVALPPRVSASDFPAAAAILERIERCLELELKWTKAERNRLYRMRDAWERRAGGRDTRFNLQGWTHNPEWYKSRAGFSHEVQVRKLSKMVKEIEDGWK